ncbi:UNVERIFIED_ORG: glycine/D-amino acid oxidase-like deaminating enzyme [Arthrobacter sp. UYEF10]
METILDTVVIGGGALIRGSRWCRVQLAALQDYARTWLPGVDAESFEAISCTYTTTPDEDFILDRIGPVLIGAGFSGHGFKFTPVVGRILADLATGTRPAPQIFSAAR